MNKLLFLIVVLISIQSYSWQESFGGDPAIADFKYRAFEFINFSYTQNDINVFAQDKDTTDKQFDHVNFVCKDNLNLNNNKVLAINYPFNNPQLIELDCDTYIKITEIDKTNLVVHELLSIFGINDIDYRQSFKFTYKFKEHLLGLDSIHQEFTNDIMNCDLKKFSQIKQTGHYMNFVYNDASAIEYSIAYNCIEILDFLIDHGIKLPKTGNLFSDKSNNIAFFLTSLAMEDVLLYQNTDLAQKRLDMVKKMLALNPDLNNVVYSDQFYHIYQNGFTPSYQFHYELDWKNKVTLQEFFNSAYLIVYPNITVPDMNNIELFRLFLQKVFKN